MRKLSFSSQPVRTNQNNIQRKTQSSLPAIRGSTYSTSEPNRQLVQETGRSLKQHVPPFLGGFPWNLSLHFSPWGGSWLTSERSGQRKLVITTADTRPLCWPFTAAKSQRHLATLDSAEAALLNHPHIFSLAPWRQLCFVSRCFSWFPRHKYKKHLHIVINW